MLGALAGLLTGCSGGHSGSSTNASVHVPQPAGIASDGIDGATIEVVLRQANGTPMVGRSVQLEATGQANQFWPAAEASTGPDGRVVLRLSSTVPERKLLTVRADLAGSPETIGRDIAVDFEAPVVLRRRVSVSSSGAEANDFSDEPAISGNGRFVAFLSKADNLVPGDTNEKEDVFLHDRLTGEVVRVSLTPTGGQFPDLCRQPSVADDGTLVAFTGRLGDDDDIWVRDLVANVTEPISAAIPLGGRNTDPAISGNGRYVAFVHHNGEQQQVYVYDRWLSLLELVSRSTAGAAGNDPSYAPSISRDGRYVAFASSADNLVPGDSNDKIDVFLRDRQLGTTTLLSRNASDEPGDDDSVQPAIAADGAFVAFASKAENLVAGDDNGKSDVFVRDLATGVIERISVDPNGQEVDKESWRPRLSADGRYVVFSSLSDDLVIGDSNGKEDIFRRDRALGRTVRVNRALGGSEPNEESTAPALASDAPVVAYTSKADNLVAGDENDKPDVFVAPRE